MSQSPPKNNGNKPLGIGHLARAALGIPIHFPDDSSSAIKIEPEQSMNNSFALSERPLMPSLFQIAARADDALAETPSKGHRHGHARLSERMLNPHKLEAVLNAIGKKKKSAAR